MNDRSHIEKLANELSDLSEEISGLCSELERREFAEDALFFMLRRMSGQEWSGMSVFKDLSQDGFARAGSAHEILEEIRKRIR